jgi:hypothetical protein
MIDVTKYTVYEYNSSMDMPSAFIEKEEFYVDDFENAQLALNAAIEMAEDMKTLSNFITIIKTTEEEIYRK